MSNHWREAQEIQRKRVGTNAVFTPDGKRAITGYEEYGWLIVTPEHSIEARTALGVEMVLEELELPLLGWC